MTRYLLLVVAATAACGTGGAATKYFKTTASCPQSSFKLEHIPTPELPRLTPPEDIARDPGRLAVWTNTQQNRQHTWEQANKEGFVNWYHATGCGQDVVFHCEQADRWEDPSTCQGFSPDTLLDVAKGSE